MRTYYKAKYWNDLKRDIAQRVPKQGEVLFVANLVIQDPISWWTKRALRKAVAALIAQNSQVCMHLILLADCGPPREMAWRGLLQDKYVMKRFRIHLAETQYKDLAALAKGLAERI